MGGIPFLGESVLKNINQKKLKKILTTTLSSNTNGLTAQ